MPIKITGEWMNVGAGAAVVDAITKGVAGAFKEATGEDMPTGFGNWSFRKNKITKEWEYGIEMDAARKAIAKAKAPAKEAPEEYKYCEVDGVKYRWRAGMEGWEVVPAAKAAVPPPPPKPRAEAPPMPASHEVTVAPRTLSLPDPVKGRGQLGRKRAAG